MSSPRRPLSPVLTPTPSPLYQKTYTLHRLTPLYSFPSLSHPTSLTPHARSLATTLRTTLLRPTTSLPLSPDPALASAGKLKRVSLDPFTSPFPDHEAREEPYGLQITLVFENAEYTALLLSGSPGKEVGEGFVNMPLMMTRMPKPLLGAFVEWLERGFDTCVKPLRLRDDVVREMVSRWVESGKVREKEVRMTFAVVREEGKKGKLGVRSMNLSIAGRDVRRFARRGWWGSVEVYLREVGGVKVGMGDGWVLRKVACGGFVVQGGEGGKWKGFEAAGMERRGEEVVERLVKVAEEGDR